MKFGIFPRTHLEQHFQIFHAGGAQLLELFALQELQLLALLKDLAGDDVLRLIQLADDSVRDETHAFDREERIVDLFGRKHFKVVRILDIWYPGLVSLFLGALQLIALVIVLGLVVLKMLRIS